ncbi:MAG TPA: hypothetical protein VMG12_21515 [Polyangiaceae bacterium]|nr:hypothetical protein [Polyangiaceae bacterium]
MMLADDRKRLDVESVDLDAVKGMLKHLCGTSVAGAVIGRTRLRDAVARHLGCSLLMAEQLVDTMIARGFISQQVHPDGWVYWAIS